MYTEGKVVRHYHSQVFYTAHQRYDGVHFSLVFCFSLSPPLPHRTGWTLTLKRMSSSLTHHKTWSTFVNSFFFSVFLFWYHQRRMMSCGSCLPLCHVWEWETMEAPAQFLGGTDLTLKVLESARATTTCCDLVSLWPKKVMALPDWHK